ncbi:MAG: DUF2955 domain-containing protein [Halieaceae bacterium]|nr:DUF2955 domain-containing protein [Halieaceae bacterium]
MTITGTGRNALRYALGITLAAAIAYAVAWQMAWLTTVLTATFLGNRGPRPSLQQTLFILAAMALIFAVGLGVTLSLYRYPGVLSLIVTLALYLTFFYAARGAPQLIVLLCVLAILVFPLIAGIASALVPAIAGSLLVSAAVALFCTQVAYTLVPGSPATRQAPPPAAALANQHAMQSAWLSCAVILPAALYSLWWNASDAILPLVMVALLSVKPDFSTGAAGGKALVAANLGGGLVALLFYQLLRMCPSYPFVLTGLFGLGLVFGQGLFSQRRIAPLYGTAFNTVLVLIGSGTGQYGAEADAKFYERLLLISLAACYVVGLLSLLQLPQLRERWMRAGTWLFDRLRPA